MSKRSKGTTAKSHQSIRHGTAAVLVLMVLGVFLIMAAMSLNVAYMQLVRTEMRAATDAAARAGAEALARTDSSSQAVAAAINIAAANKVSGTPLVLNSSHIQLGSATQNGSSDQWTFTDNGTPLSSVRVNADKIAPLMLGGVTGTNEFHPDAVATAAFTEMEICLVVDRSHSMCFDLSGFDWAYPSGTPAAPPDPVVHPPHATGSRWAALASGVDVFLTTIAATNTTQRVALVTWGSQITLASYEGSLTGRTFTAADLNLPLSLDYTAVRNEISSLGSDVMLGGTNLSAGIDLGVVALTDGRSRKFANKVMIVMTDGQWNAGRDPLLAAQDATQAGITIHTVTFLDRANQQDMIDVAQASGGRHYHASDTTTLENAFREIARHLAVVLID